MKRVSDLVLAPARRVFERASARLRPKPVEEPAPAAPKLPDVDIVICVHNARKHVEACLAALMAHTAPPFRLIIVDDGSNRPVTKRIDAFCAIHPDVVSIRNEEARGYCRAANQGLRVSTADYVVLLNSDTLVTPGWLQRLVDCALARPQGGVFGPLSNAAMFQSIPHLKDRKGRWVVNALPPGVDLQAYAAAIATAGEPLYPEVRFMNGFCYMISRAALDRVGLFDEETFPQGYGEEDDFSLRAYKAGFTLHVADNAYVFHAKSQSYSDARREEILVATKDSLRNKHSLELVVLAAAETLGSEALLKSRVRAILATEAITRQASQHLITAPTVDLGWAMPRLDESGASRRALAVRSRIAGGGAGAPVLVTRDWPRPRRRDLTPWRWTRPRRSASGSSSPTMRKAVPSTAIGSTRSPNMPETGPRSCISPRRDRLPRGSGRRLPTSRLPGS